MPLSISCAWCAAPLLDEVHAKKHVSTKCKSAPWSRWRTALELIRDSPDLGAAAIARDALVEPT